MYDTDILIQRINSFRIVDSLHFDEQTGNAYDHQGIIDLEAYPCYGCGKHAGKIEVGIICRLDLYDDGEILDAPLGYFINMTAARNFIRNFVRRFNACKY